MVFTILVFYDHKFVQEQDANLFCSNTGLGTCFKEYGTGKFEHKDIELYVWWPKKLGKRVPSLISQGVRDSNSQWGFDIGDDSIAVMWANIGLDPRSASGDAGHECYLKDTFNRDRLGGKLCVDWKATYQMSKEPVEVAKEYLLRLREEVIGSLGRLWLKSIVQSIPSTLTITFPSYWSEEGRNNMIEAVKNSWMQTDERLNLLRITVITELEAAAIYSWVDYVSSHKRDAEKVCS